MTWIPGQAKTNSDQDDLQNPECIEQQAFPVAHKKAMSLTFTSRVAPWVDLRHPYPPTTRGLVKTKEKGRFDFGVATSVGPHRLVDLPVLFMWFLLPAFEPALFQFPRPAAPKPALETLL